jgi:hypothetical protein
MSAREAYLAELRADVEKKLQLIALIEGTDGPSGGGGGGAGAKTSAGKPAESPNVGRHEFVGLSTPDATKRYLRKIGQRLASPREVAGALIQGGQSTQDVESVYVNVYSALKRLRAAGEVVKQGQEWGLAEVFPALARRNASKPKETNGAADKGATDESVTGDESVA